MFHVAGQIEPSTSLSSEHLFSRLLHRLPTYLLLQLYIVNIKTIGGGGGGNLRGVCKKLNTCLCPSVWDMYSSAHPRAALPCVVTWHVWPCVMSRCGRVHMAYGSRFAWGVAAEPSSFSTIFLLFSVSNYSLSPRSLSSWSYLLFHSLAKQLPLPDSAPLDSMAG